VTTETFFAEQFTPELLSRTDSLRTTTLVYTHETAKEIISTRHGQQLTY